MEPDIDLGLLPIDPEALTATIKLLYTVRLAQPTPMSEDTVEGLLMHVSITFNEFVASVLFDGQGNGTRVGPNLEAGIHACAVACLLATISDKAPYEGQHFAQNGGGGSRQTLVERWLKAIAEMSFVEEDPVWRPTPTSYVWSTALMLSMSARALLEEPRIAIDPEEVPDRPRPMGTDITPEDAAVLLVRCAAAALCMAALLAPDFRLEGKE